MDALILSRIQFGFTLAFHILWPTLTIGLAGLIAILEWRWLRTGDEDLLRLVRFLARIFALAFGVGVVSGVVLSYEFGTNFGPFSQATGNVLGPLLTYEVLSAFFLEAGFLGLMLFGWKRVPARVHFLATLMVALGTLVSAFWILAANSWMQTPQGHALEAGVFYVLDWWEVIFNPSFPYRFLHMVVASYLTASFVVAGVCAYLIRTGRQTIAARKGLSFALWAALLLAPVQILLGDLHGLNTFEHQPVKVAAMEGAWHTESGAPLVLFAWPDQEAATNRYAIEVPRLASLILTHSPEGTVPGLDQVAPEERPHVPIVFFAFRLMVGIGFVLLIMALAGAWLRWRGRLYDAPRFHRALILVAPLGLLATVAGWLVTEVGRQPWLIQGLYRTAEGASILPPGAVWTSLGLFVVVYHLLLGSFFWFFLRVVRAGPEAELPDDLQRPVRRTAWIPID